MELKDFCACMEQIAPRALALDFDNVGLLVEPDHTEIKKVLLALDCTTVTAREAVDLGADLLVTHHLIDEFIRELTVVLLQFSEHFFLMCTHVSTKCLQGSASAVFNMG